MCPACIATAAWIAAGAGSAGGLTAFVFARRRPRASKNEAARQLSSISIRCGEEAASSAQSSSSSKA
jgi:hypothetical protein